MQVSQNQRKGKKLETNQDKDIISNLPDEILHNILNLLPTKHAVATTALSRRWVNFWTTAFLSHLEFNDLTLIHSKRSNPNPTLEKTLFVNFVNNVLRLLNLSKVTSLTLSCFESYGSFCINSWLRAACTRNIVELDIYVVFDKDPIRLPTSVYTSTSLVVLKLNANVKLDINSYQVCFPSLKILHIFVYNQKDDDLTRRLYSRCPVLEDLFLEGQILYKHREVQFQVCSSTLKRLKIDFSLVDRVSSVDYSFVICAKNLEYLDVFDNFLAEYHVLNSQVLDRANIRIAHPSLPSKLVEYYYVNRAFEFLEGLSLVKSLSLSGCTVGALSYINQSKLEDIDDEFDDDLNDRLQSFGNLPTFNCLTNLELGFQNCGSWTILPYILQCSPNLEFLALKKVFLDSMKTEIRDGVQFVNIKWPWKEPEPVPICMLHRLKEIDIVGFEGKPYELTVVEFLLKGAQVLQRMAIHSQPLSSAEEMKLHKTIFEYPRGSEDCQIKIFSKSLLQP